MRYAPRPFGDPVVPPRRPAADCLRRDRSGYPRAPHATERTAESVITCIRCGSGWLEDGILIRPPSMELQLASAEWRRIATPRRSAVHGPWSKPLLEWMNWWGVIDAARLFYRDHPVLLLAAVAVFWLSFFLTRAFQ